MNCPYCKSELVQKRGIKNNHQSYQCQDCKKYFTDEEFSQLRNWIIYKIKTKEIK